MKARIGGITFRDNGKPSFVRLERVKGRPVLRVQNVHIDTPDRLAVATADLIRAIRRLRVMTREGK
jgi:hypothetical protein